MSDAPASGPPPIHVLFVCMGNICRSPLAEGVFRHHAERRGVLDRFVVDSAGTGDWHVGNPPDHRMRAVAEERGVPLDSAARQVRSRDFQRFDHILCADADNLDMLLTMGAPPEKTRLLLECDPGAPTNEVPDPYYGGREGFDRVYDLVDGACAALLEQLLAGARAPER